VEICSAGGATWGMWRGYGAGCARGVDERDEEVSRPRRKVEKRIGCKIMVAILTIRQSFFFVIVTGFK
jgi:hypothetical protein